MSTSLNPTDQSVLELIGRYRRWRRIYHLTGNSGSSPDEPDWENGKLYFRRGYPYPEWSAYVIEASDVGAFYVLRASSEHRNAAVEMPEVEFSRFEDAGKYIIYKTVSNLRVECHMESIARSWRADGLDEQVVKIPIASDRAKYMLQSDPAVYFIAFAGGIQPYNRILTLSYDELEIQLQRGFPASILSQSTSPES